MREARSYCRICGVLCGTRLQIDDDGRIVDVRGDKEHPLTRGFACIKGVQSTDIYDGPERLLHPLKRLPDGTFERIPLEQALDEIAGKLQVILAQDGPEAVATFRGTANYTDAAGYHMLPAWMKAIGSPSFFSTLTIDQSAKAVTAGRLGMWAGGKHEFHNADVWMLAGINPMVSNWGGFGSLPPNPVLTLKEAKARGVKIIVVDPRRTETSHFADVFLQLRPGEDPTLAAGLLRAILTQGWFDAAFCERHVEGLDDLRAAVDPFTPEYVERRAGIAPELLLEAARLFAEVGTRGIVITGTGPDMAARSNLAEHLYECLNVVCGRYLREGEEARDQRVLAGRFPLRAEVIAPRRPWEKGHRSRIRGVGTLAGEMMSGVMADEILLPGKGQIRSLIVVGGNPANAFPDQLKTVKALSTLDLLVAIDPYLSETARLAHYVLPPLLPYERADLPLGFPQAFAGPFAQYTPAIADPPAGAEVIDDWRVFWELANRLGRQLIFDGVELDMVAAPQRDELLAILARRSVVPLDEVKRHSGGKLFDIEPHRVQPARVEANGRFAVAPEDIVRELGDVFRETATAPAAITRFTHRLVSRRLREVMNTTYRHLPSTRRKFRYNPAYMHSSDIASQGLAAGDRVEIESDHGRIPAIVAPDDTVLPGVISMSHGWGGLPEEELNYEDSGAATTLLISTDRDVEAINSMPRMSAIPVRIVAAQSG